MSSADVKRFNVTQRELSFFEQHYPIHYKILMEQVGRKEIVIVKDTAPEAGA